MALKETTLGVLPRFGHSGANGPNKKTPFRVMIWRGKAGDSLFRIMSIIPITNPLSLVKMFFHLTAQCFTGVICKMKQTYQKLKNWFRGKQIHPPYPYSPPLRSSCSLF